MADTQYKETRPPDLTPAKPIVSYPTPNINDTIIREVVDSWKGDYTPLPYGTSFDSVTHTAYVASFPNHKLVYQAPSSTSGQYVTRIWANNRINQDEYNYSLKYADEDPDYPTYVRVYVLPRDGYTPLPALSPDPQDPDAFLVSQEVINETDPPELSSEYIKVVRVYETLPGPVVQSIDYDTELKILVYTDRQVVLSSTTPVPTDLTLELRETPRSKYTKLRITSYLQTLPESKTEYNTGRYNFPALVFDISLSVEELTPGRSEVYWFPNSMRAEPNVPAIYRVVTSFFTAAPAPSTIFTLPMGNLIYNGISYTINIGQVLNDEITVDAEFVGDERYGDLQEEHIFPATPLSATQYTDLIGTYQLVGVEINRWRGSIWVAQNLFVLLI